jgi:hypothetical protein
MTGRPAQCLRERGRASAHLTNQSITCATPAPSGGEGAGMRSPSRAPPGVLRRAVRRLALAGEAAHVRLEQLVLVKLAGRWERLSHTQDGADGLVGGCTARTGPTWLPDAGTSRLRYYLEGQAKVLAQSWPKRLDRDRIAVRVEVSEWPANRVCKPLPSSSVVFRRPHWRCLLSSGSQVRVLPGASSGGRFRSGVFAIAAADGQVPNDAVEASWKRKGPGSELLWHFDGIPSGPASQGSR